MYYFDRADGLKSIPSKTECPEERQILEALCNIHWDLFGGEPTNENHLMPFRNAAHHSKKIVWDWAMIGIALNSEFDEKFRELFVELLLDDNIEVRRRMASKVQRIEGEALQAVFPTLFQHHDATLRNIAYRLCTGPSDEAGVLQEQLRTLVSGCQAESDPGNQQFLARTIDTIRSRLHRARKSKEVFDWDLYERELARATEAAISEITVKHPNIRFRGCLLYCNEDQFGSVIIQMARANPESMIERLGGKGPTTCNFDDHIYSLGVGEAFDKIWSPLAEVLDMRRFDASSPWAEGENPDEDFMLMACRVAHYLHGSPSVAALNRTDDFRVIVLSEAESEELSMERLERVAAEH